MEEQTTLEGEKSLEDKFIDLMKELNRPVKAREAAEILGVDARKDLVPIGKKLIKEGRARYAGKRTLLELVPDKEK